MELEHIRIKQFATENGSVWHEIPLSYQVYGPPLGQAPVILVIHALTGNSQLTGPKGWWDNIVGANKPLDTNRYSILAFNVPGNGYDGFLISNYKDFKARDIARIFSQGLAQIGVQKLFAIIGGSVGGGIAWELAVLQPKLATHLISIAADWRSTDWMIANTRVQEQILRHSPHPVHDARLHAMLCYRSPQSLNARFNRSWNEDKGMYNVESWLLHHGKKLQQRFQLAAYMLMNNLLGTVDITRGRGTLLQVVENMHSQIHLIAVDSDLFFPSYENRQTLALVKEVKKDIFYYEIHSLHGHDAFLIEWEQLATIFEGIFEKVGI